MESKNKQEEFMRYYEPLHDRFVRFCKAKAYGAIDYNDLVNEAVLRAFEGFEKIRNKAAFPGYLYSIASNIVKTELRSKKNKEMVEICSLPPALLEQNHALRKFEVEILYKALALLPEAQRDSIILFEINGYSLKEVCDIQEAGLSAVKQRLKRGRARLAELLNVPALEAESTGKRSQILMTLFF